MRRRLFAGLGALAASCSLLIPATEAAAVPATITPVGGAPALAPAKEPGASVTNLVASRNGGGWLLASNGEVQAVGGAPFFGHLLGQAIGGSLIDLVPTPTGAGYWLVTSDGGVFTFGDALFAGSAAGQSRRPIVGAAATSTGQGYFLVASDGGVFTFGDATYRGSLPEVGIPAEVVDVVNRAVDDGYWLIGADGSNYAFGAAPSVGGLPDRGLRARVVSAVSTPSNAGLWQVTSDGAVHAYGDAAPTVGAAPPGGQRTAAVAAPADATGLWLANTAGLLPARSGQRGAHVRAIEEKLASLSYWVGAVDGFYDSNLSQAVMAFQKYSGLGRDGVAGPATVDALGRATYVTARTTSGNIVEVDKARQIMMVVVNGRVVNTFNVSTGSEKPYRERSPKSGKIVTGDAKTPDGRFRVNFERPNGWRESDLGKLWRPKYFNGGIAVHGSLSIPGYPASHGCVRVSVPAMDHIWAADLMPMGRSVWVYS
jgi:peptidoglycan hydrolase-like protein with peptidoglycan-binding domain